MQLSFEPDFLGTLYLTDKIIIIVIIIPKTTIIAHESRIIFSIIVFG